MTIHGQLVGNSVRIRMTGKAQAQQVGIRNGHLTQSQGVGYLKDDHGFTVERQALKTRKAYKKWYRKFREDCLSRGAYCPGW